MYNAWQIADGLSEYWPGHRKKKKWKKWNEAEKESGKGDEAEESKTWRHSKSANMAKSDQEPTASVPLEHL